MTLTRNNPYLISTSLLFVCMAEIYSGQIIDFVTDPCARSYEIEILRKELDVLLKVVKDQEVRLNILEGELTYVKQKNCQCESLLSSPESHPTTKMTMTTTNVMVTSSTITSTSQRDTANGLSESIGSRGREFLVLFMRNHPYASGSLTIYVTTDNETTVNISSSPHLKPSIKSAVDSSVSITSNSKCTLPFELTCEYVKVEPKAVIVRTSELSTVTIFDSFYINTNDGTLVIPTHKLSNQYLISTTEPYSTSIDYSQFAIGALIDRTDITIKFKMANTSRITLLGGTYSDGDVFSITLDRFETFQANHNTDLSGTFITSTEPIAVFSGNRCNKLKNNGGCNHMLTQLPPTTELDHQFIVPPFFHNSETLIQVVTQTHNAVNITIEGSESSWILNEREFRNLKSNQIAVLVSRQPVLITGFGMGLPYDTYMTVIPGVHQYLAFYKITIPSGYTENFLCLIIPAVSIDNLQINGLSRDHYNTVYQSSVYLDKAYDVRVFQVKNTGETFVLSTTDKSKFGLIVYGHRAFDGYGFSGNFVLP